jgi:hypothetical protein
MKRLTLLLALICTVGTSWGYIEPVAEDQEATTLPRLLLHFSKSVAVVEVQRVDADRGMVRFAVVERIQGAQELKEVRQLFLREGRMPDGLRNLKVGQKAVFFGEDSEGQSFLYVPGLWCHSLLRDDSGWRRLHDIRPLYNGCFAGSVDELTVALKRLVMGQEAVVRCRPTNARGEAWVRYDMRTPEQKSPVEPSDVPAAQDAAAVDPARARELREGELAGLRRRIRQMELTEGKDSPRMRPLQVELRKRQQGLESPKERVEQSQRSVRLELAEIEKRIEILKLELRELEQERESLRRDLAERD